MSDLSDVSPSQKWHVALGDPTCVFDPNLSKPINCHSHERAALVVAAVNSTSEMLQILDDIVRSEWTSVTLRDMTPQHRTRLERARALIAKMTSLSSISERTP